MQPVIRIEPVLLGTRAKEIDIIEMHGHSIVKDSYLARRISTTTAS